MLLYPQSAKGKAFMVLWLIACLAVLVASYIERNTSEWGMVVHLLMIVLTFPSGYAFDVFVFAPVFRFLMAHEIFFLNERGFIPYLIAWSFFVAVGYLQWFVLVPWLARRLIRWFEPPTQS